MKWIGQHIWDFISRFRSDVYLENISDGTVANDKFLGLDANNKIVKETVSTTVTDLHSAGVNGSANQVLTDDGDGTITSESNLNFSGETLTVGASDGGHAYIGRAVSTSVGGELQVFGGAGTGTNQAGGDLELGGGVPTGSAAWGSIKFLSGITGSSGSASAVGNVETIAEINSYQTTTNSFSLYAPTTTTQYFKISTAAQGATTIYTDDSGGGSTNADLTFDVDGDIVLDSASDVIKTGSTAFVNNSGVIQVATQGTIDHDSLANFVANEHIDWTTDQGGTNIHTGNYTNTTYTSSDFDHNSLTNYVAAEHYRWDNDNSGTATIHTNNITDLHGAGVNGAAGNILTDAGNGQITDNSNLTFDGMDLTVSSLITSKPKLTIENTTVDNKPSSLSFYKNRSVGNGTNDDFIGSITWDGKDASGNAHEYAMIQAQIVESTHTDEAGLLQFKVASSTGSSSSGRVFLKGTGSASDNDVDVEIGYGSTSMTTVTGDLTVAGSITGKQYQVYQQSFIDDLGTVKHYLPWRDTDEQTTIYQEEAAMVAPADGRIVSVTIRCSSLENSGGNRTIGIHTLGPNTSQFTTGNWTEEETETLAIAATDDNHVFHFAFDNSKHFESGELVSLSIQDDADLNTGSRYVYVSTVVEWDYSTLLGGTSLETDVAI